MVIAMKNTEDFQDPMLFGENPLHGVVAIEALGDSKTSQVRLFIRKGDKVVAQDESFTPLLLATDATASQCPIDHKATKLAGKGPLNTQMTFSSWKLFGEGRKWLQSETGETPGSPSAP